MLVLAEKKLYFQVASSDETKSAVVCQTHEVLELAFCSQIIENMLTIKV